MSCDPSYLSPTLVFDPDPFPPPVIKLGKRCGIYALLCGIEPYLATILHGLTVGLSLDSMVSPMGDIIVVTVIILDFFCSPCFIAGIVLGMIGRDTEGKTYATIGLWLSLLFFAMSVLFGLLYIFSFVVFGGSPGVSGATGGRCC